jgi:hypothetical protein
MTASVTIRRGEFKVEKRFFLRGIPAFWENSNLPKNFWLAKLIFQFARLAQW